MGWAIFFLFCVAVNYLIATAPDDDERFWKMVFWVIGSVLMIVGSTTMYFSGTGEIARPNVFWHQPIYKVVGQGFPYGSGGKQITILQNGKEDVFAVWLTIPKGAQFIRLTEDNKAEEVNYNAKPDSKQNPTPTETIPDSVANPKTGK
jgi:hypothetical protein